MARKGPAQAFIFVGGYNVSGYTYTLTQTVESLMEETHGLGDSAEEYLPVGIARTTLEASGGLWDDTELDPAFVGKGETEQLVLTGPDSAIGGACSLLNGVYASAYNRIAARDGLTKANATYTVSGTNQIGVVLHGITSETTAGDTESSSVDNGASSASGATCDLHVPALTLGGYTNCIVTVRDSTDDITFGDLVAFTAVTTSPTAERKTVAGPIERYCAMKWEWTGAGSGQSVTPVVAIARG
jgi:hypothetical protein